MLENLISIYGTFDDFILNKIEYFFDEKKANVFIYCFNRKSMNYENIKIELFDIINFFTIDFIYYHQSIFVDRIGDNIVFDFDPIDHFDFLKENPKSKFKIMCKAVKFHILL